MFDIVGELRPVGMTGGVDDAVPRDCELRIYMLAKMEASWYGSPLVDSFIAAVIARIAHTRRPFPVRLCRIGQPWHGIMPPRIKLADISHHKSSRGFAVPFLGACRFIPGLSLVSTILVEGD